MLQSMTGFGRTECTLGDFACSIEIKSLNGKQFEINTKLPPILKFYEIDLRNRIQQQLSRGSIDVSILLKQHGVSKPISVNMELAQYYYESMMQIGESLQLKTNDPLATLMRMPDIVGTSSDSVNEEEWKIIAQKIDEACTILNKHRSDEGEMLTKHISNNIETIKQLCNQVKPHEKNRVERVREKLTNAIQEFLQSTNFDKNRLEQEIIYYIEKFDITEEKNRLTHHCDYFKQLLMENGNVKGKKLGFVLQEIGREINTMGSKANDVDIQKIVVIMKDELEQAKEQLLNAL
jgi:uncharacterized protein (TIGR00255 family)